MDKDLYYLFHMFLPLSSLMFFGFTFPHMGYLEADSIMGYLDTIPKEHFHEFFMILVYFVVYFGVSLLIVCLCVYFVWVVYRLSLSRIYSKPRRVYPAEKQKFFSLY